MIHHRTRRWWFAAKNRPVVEMYALADLERTEAAFVAALGQPEHKGRDGQEFTWGTPWDAGGGGVHLYLRSCRCCVYVIVARDREHILFGPLVDNPCTRWFRVPRKRIPMEEALRVARKVLAAAKGAA